MRGDRLISLVYVIQNMLTFSRFSLSRRFSVIRLITHSNASARREREESEERDSPGGIVAHQFIKSVKFSDLKNGRVSSDGSAFLVILNTEIAQHFERV